MKWLVVTTLCMVGMSWYMNSLGFTEPAIRPCLYVGAAFNMLGYAQGIIDGMSMKKRRKSPL